MIAQPFEWLVVRNQKVGMGEEHLVRPDIAGWRRDRLQARPSGSPVREQPDWTCVILSPANASDDTVRKFRIYQEAAVPHYWILDPISRALTVYRWSSEGYVVALVARGGEVVRAEPFADVELLVESLLGEDPRE